MDDGYGLKRKGILKKEIKKINWTRLLS